MTTRTWRLLAMAVAALFCVLIVALTWQLEDSVRDSNRQRLDGLANETANQLVVAASFVSLEIEALKAVFLGSHRVTEEEFRTVVEQLDLTSANTYFRAVAIMPVLRRDDIDFANAVLAFRSPMRRQLGYDDVQIAPDASRGIYMPALYVESPEGRRGITGFDIATDASRRAAAMRALAEDSTVATVPLTLSQDGAGADPSVLIVAGLKGVNLGFRLEQLDHRPETVLAISFTPATMIERVFPGLDERTFRFHLTDVTDGETVPLYADPGLDKTDAISSDRTIGFLNRQWRVAVVDALPATDASTYRWLAAVGLLLTISVAAAVDRLIIGRDVLSAGIGQATSDLERANQRLAESARAAEAANRAKSEFLANMSHELRSPLNSIIGFAQMIANEPFGPAGHPNYVEYASLIERAGMHQLALVNDILDIASVEAGRFRLRMERVNPSRVLAECADMFQVQVASGAVDMRVDCDRAPEWVMADVRALRQIAINLISNALKFSPKGGAVVVAVEAAGDDAFEIRVSDTGPGIREKDLKLVLEPFGQVHDDSMIAHAGVGLGLPIAKRLAEAHGGSLSIESEIGAGTTVVVTLPRKARDADQPASVQNE